MSKIISINGKYDLKSINNAELIKIVKIFNDNIDYAKEVLSSEMSKNNFKFLLTNYIETISELSKLDNECKQLNDLSKMLYAIVKDITNPSTIVDCIFVFFNIFRVCGFDINKLSIEEIHSVVNIYYMFENEVDFSKTDSFAAFILDDNFIEEVRKYNHNKRELCMLYVDAAACCIDDNIFSTYQMKKYVKQALEKYSYVDEEKSYNNIHELYDYLYEQVSIYSQMLFSTEDEKNVKMANKWLWYLDILKTKINNASDEQKDIYFTTISNVFLGEENKELSLGEKINKVFGFVFPSEKIIEFKSKNSK